MFTSLKNLLKWETNFANKMWNGSRFVIMNLEGFDVTKVDKSKLKYELVDKWIFSRLNETAAAVAENLDNFLSSDKAAKSVYEFLRGDFCDWYVEMAKIRLYNSEDANSKLTAHICIMDSFGSWNDDFFTHLCLISTAKEIWQTIKAEGETVMLAQYPVADEKLIDKNVEKSFEYIKELISSLRNIRLKLEFILQKTSKSCYKNLLMESELQITIKLFLYNKNLENLELYLYGKDMEKPAQSGFRVTGNSEVYMILKGLLDIEAEVKKLQAQLDKVAVRI